MSSILASAPSALTILRTVPAVLGVALTLVGLNISLNPQAALGAFGFPPLTANTHAEGPLAPIMASRNIALGTGFITMWYLGMDRAAGALLMIASVAPVVDTYVTVKWGRKGGWKGHAIGAVVSIGFGAALVSKATK